MLEQVELSNIEEVEALPGDGYSFSVHFKANKKPWHFSALSEVSNCSTHLIMLPWQFYHWSQPHHYEPKNFGHIL